MAEFQLHLFDNIALLHEELKSGTYHHGGYEAFRLNDPKPREIHKASVRDRLVHHVLYRELSRTIDRTFIHNSYSCRDGKGTHKAINQFRRYACIVSKNHTKTCWVLKCDIMKFFASIDHVILKRILEERIADKRTLTLLDEVIDSFHTDRKKGVGLPLGNLTSQILVNIYMNVYDQCVKRTLKVKHYIRYADDFVLLSMDKVYLLGLIPQITNFLGETLHLDLHPHKVSLTTLATGVDFLGWVHFPYHRVLRTSTKKRMLKKINQQNSTSYTGVLSHGNTYELRGQINEVRTAIDSI